MNKKWICGLCFAFLAVGCSEPVPNTPPGGDQCDNGKRQCNPMGTSVDVCKDGKWEVEQPCPIPMVCNEAALQCRQPNDDSPVGKVCNEGDKQCHLNGYITCVKSADGVESWALTPCGPQQYCDPVTFGCVDNANVNPDFVCTDWMRKCENNSVWTCKDNAWSETESCGNDKTCSDVTLTCVPKKPDPVCTTGAIQCDTDGSRVLRCDDGAWAVQETCANGTSCDPTSLSCTDGCTDGTYKCDALDRVMVCNGTDWSVKAECNANQICNATTGNCDKAPECTNGAIQCNSSNSGMNVCENGTWKPGESCKSGYQCAAGTCVPAKSCSGSASECRNGDIVACVNGAEITTDCGSNACIVRDGTPVCEPYVCDDGDFHCKDKRNLQTCQNNAYTYSACDASEHCDDAKGCVKTICTEGDKRCTNNNVEICSDNAWVIDKTCGTDKLCDTTSKTCIDVVCNNGDKYCNGNTIVVCKNNAFTEDITCTSAQTCTESSNSASCVTKVCNDGEYQCDGKALQICENNAWKTSKTCTSEVLCNAGNGTCDTQVCTVGATKCSNSKKSVMECKDNAWKVKEQCSTSGAQCEASGANHVCVAQEPWVCDDGTTCDGNTLKVCADNAYVLEKSCLASETCNATNKSCDPKPECTPGEYKCTGSSLFKCNTKGFWATTATKTCTGYEVCDATLGTCVDTSVCTDGTYYCDANKLQKCAGGQWQTEKTCNATLETCNASTKTCDLIPVCTSGEISCNGLTLRTCVSGQWTNTTTCSGGKTCSKTLGKCIECSEGDKKCSDDGKATLLCTNGEWVKTTCAGSSYCSDTLLKCIECETGTYQCSSNKLQSCSTNNKWATTKTCQSTEYCDASQKTCVLKDVCTTGAYSCDGQTLKKCDSGQWTTAQTCSSLETCNAAQKSCVLKPVCEPGITRCNANVYQTCDADGQWKATKDCGTSAICQTNGTLTECVDKLTLPTWCNIQGVDAHAKGYGRVLMPTDVEHSEISAQFVCGNVDSPVKSWTYSADALRNTGCTNCFDNTEYMSFSMDAPAGNYACTYVFDFGPESIACLPKTGSGDGGAPIILADDTKLTAETTMPMTIPTASTEAPTWCHFKHLDTANVVGYGRIYLPGNTTPAQVKAMLICGDIAQPAATWTHTSNAIQNIFCGNDCGNNVEFESYAMTLSSGNWSCAFRFDVSGKSYVCPTNGNNGTPVELTSSTILTANESWGFTK